jgi:membrane protein DedA with SNARE-associated domain
MSFLSSGIVPDLLSKYGYLAVGGIVGLESMGVPLPGETTLIIAAIYAATTHQLNIWLVIAAAAAGAIIGDNIGYWLGREFGYRLLLRYGRYVGLTERRIKLGQYLFMRYGSAVVFFGRFVAVLRALAAFLAGANHMQWWRFLLANAAGGIIWTTSYGLGAYYLGKKMEELSGPVGIALGVVGGAAIIAWIVFIRRHQAELEEKAERALPGPLRPVHKRKAG